MRTDILLNENFTFQEDPETHDFIEGSSDEQHVQLAVLTSKGDWKENPWAGLGIAHKLNSRYNAVQFERDLRAELEADGYMNINIITGEDLSDVKIEINEAV